MNSMLISNILCWNCRGISNPNTRNRLWELIKKHKPHILCLVETRANEDRCSCFCKKLSKDWDWAAVPALGLSGGLLTFWKKGIGLVTPLAISRNVIHLIISSVGFDGWILSFVYNPQGLSAQKLVWGELAKLSRIKVPWLVAGDFNAITSEAEHQGGSFNHYAAKSVLFNDFVSFNNLFDLGFTGNSFTWCNGQSGCARRWARLDRFFANLDWVSLFDSLSVLHLQRISSDHAPLFSIFV